MSITRANMQVLRAEYLKDATNRGSWENEAEAIKIAVLMANNNGFTVYKSLPTVYEELRFNLIFSYLTNVFVDSPVSVITEEETGKRSVIVDWSGNVSVVQNGASSEIVDPASSVAPNLEPVVEFLE
jgi:hypothetical protein